MQLIFTFSYFICSLPTRTKESCRHIWSDDFFDAFYSVYYQKNNNFLLDLCF